jgi:hypothetical protein
LGAEVIAMGVSPDGFNINDGVGSTATGAAAQRIREVRADLGICLDGDADRVILLDETGAEADGDQIMALLAERWAAEGRLKGGTLVATVMSNLGLERFLAGKGLSLHRTAVGDRYVVEAMRENGWNLGGEQSGHIVMTDYATTGDGLMAALQFLAEMVRTGQPASAGAPVRAGAADAEERALRRRDRAPGRSGRQGGDCRGRGAPDRHGPRADPQVRDRAPDPRHGGGRGRALMGRSSTRSSRRCARRAIEVAERPSGRIPFVSVPASGGSFGMGALPPACGLPRRFSARMKRAQASMRRPAT